LKTTGKYNIFHTKFFSNTVPGIDVVELMQITSDMQAQMSNSAISNDLTQRFIFALNYGTKQVARSVALQNWFISRSSLEQVLTRCFLSSISSTSCDAAYHVKHCRRKIKGCWTHTK